MAGLADTVASAIGIDVTSDLTGAIQGVWVEKLYVSSRPAVSRDDMRLDELAVDEAECIRAWNCLRVDRIGVEVALNDDAVGRAVD